MSENIFAKKRNKRTLHSLPPAEETIEKAKPKSFSVFKQDLETLDDVCEKLEASIHRKVTKSLAVRMGIYYLANMLEHHDGLDEEMEKALKECRSLTN